MKRWMALSTAALLLHALPAAAGSNELFSTLDADHNGTISRQEMESADLVVRKLPDGSKEVTSRDLLNGGEAAFLSREQKKELFNRIDANHSGTIDRKEWDRATRSGIIRGEF